jgi:hypothetical protein
MIIVTALRRSTVMIGLSFNWLIDKSYRLDCPQMCSCESVSTSKAL